MSTFIHLQDIYAARKRIHGRVGKTPLILSSSLSEPSGAVIHLKLEHHQTTHNFKLRGATNAILRLDDAERARGVVGASTGNRGRGLAYAATMDGVPLAMKTANPAVWIVGTSMERAAAMVESQPAGMPVLGEELPIAAGSLGGIADLHNRYTFAMLRQRAADLITVTEAQIAVAARPTRSPSAISTERAFKTPRSRPSPMAEWSPTGLARLSPTRGRTARHVRRTGSASAECRGRVDGLLTGRHYPGLIAIGEILVVIAARL